MFICAKLYEKSEVVKIFVKEDLSIILLVSREKKQKFSNLGLNCFLLNNDQFLKKIEHRGSSLIFTNVYKGFVKMLHYFQKLELKKNSNKVSKTFAPFPWRIRK